MDSVQCKLTVLRTYPAYVTWTGMNLQLHCSITNLFAVHNHKALAVNIETDSSNNMDESGYTSL